MAKIAFIINAYGDESVGGSVVLCNQLVDLLSNEHDVDVVTYSKNCNIPIKESNVVKLPIVNKESVRLFISEQNYDIGILVNYKEEYLSIIDLIDRTFFMPLCHDEVISSEISFKKIVEEVDGFFFLTPEEKNIVEKNNNLRNKPFVYSMYFINGEKETTTEVETPVNYILYAGRQSSQKNFYEMTEFFSRYKKRNPRDLKLVTIGKIYNGGQRVSSEDIIDLGFIDNRQKKEIYSHAKALVIPSLYESLSIVLLEALYYCTPVIVNGKCDVLQGQCIRSGGGIWYDNYGEFEAILNRITEDKELVDQMVRSGYQYVKNVYSREKVLERFNRLVFELKGDDGLDNINAVDICKIKQDIKSSINETDLNSPSFGGINYRRFIRSAKLMNQIVIVGGGNVGGQLLSSLENEGIQTVVAFADNNSTINDKYGKRFMRIPAAVQEYPEAYYIVTPIGHEWEIIYQLVEEGVPKDHIEIYSLEFHEE